MTATSTEHNTASSCAFLKRPPFRFRKVLEAVDNVSQCRIQDPYWVMDAGRLTLIGCDHP
jgi:hypothetical protein